MEKILIFGNSGSGKSTRAKALCSAHNLAHLDLDTLAWAPGSAPTRMPLADSETDINDFTRTNHSWVIEGCYTDLLELVLTQATEIIFMNLPVEACIANARSRPWEPHKYASKALQDENLNMLIDWIGMYTQRNDTFSFASHEALYKNYKGSKRMMTSNDYN